MCGIVGYLSSSVPAQEALILSMAARIAYRGPDAEGAWADPSAGIALGQRRLAIVDLSAAGHQPMVSADGRLILVFNGEIYNHRALRHEVEAAGWKWGWRGHSDTETLLAALQLWGLADTLPRLNGMFALALWNRETRKLSLARDRTGEKPLYYGWIGQSLVFGSELKALSGFPNWEGKIDRNVLSLYLRHGYVPDPHCIYCDFVKLPAAHWLELSDGQRTAPVRYWDFHRVATRARPPIALEMAIKELDRKLHAAVGLRMEADVPLGAFLSGGIDSSTIVALMQAQSTQPVRTFTIGFDVVGYNEAENAKAVAAHLGTDHTELYLTPKDALEVIPRLPEIWDEPFADPSQIPTFLLSRMTREHVTVALSGDGGDELFCGYNRYNQGFALHRSMHAMPPFLRQVVAGALSTTPVQAIDQIARILPQRIRYPALGDRLKKLGMVLSGAEGPGLYRALVSQFQHPETILPGAEEPPTILSCAQDWPKLDDFREVMMYLDTLTYLPGDILTKVDRASMAVSLEVRVPFLDPELIECAWSLPLDVKQREGRTKWVLRQVLARYVPDKLIERPKMGFGVPIEHWLSAELREWAEELLSPARLEAEGHFDTIHIRKLWEEYISGSRRWHNQIWTILMFQAWLQRMRD
nr:asparagine synthase (glutamine-hydrolyzing) [Sphingomonas sp. Y57]